MSKMRKISLSTPMDLLMRDYPQVLTVLFDNNMHCLGCPLIAFHDVSDAAFEHRLNEDILLSELNFAASANAI